MSDDTLVFIAVTGSLAVMFVVGVGASLLHASGILDAIADRIRKRGK